MISELIKLSNKLINHSTIEERDGLYDILNNQINKADENIIHNLSLSGIDAEDAKDILEAARSLLSEKQREF